MHFVLDPLLVNFTAKISALHLSPGQWRLTSQGVVFCWSLGIFLTFCELTYAFNGCLLCSIQDSYCFYIFSGNGHWCFYSINRCFSMPCYFIFGPYLSIYNFRSSFPKQLSELYQDLSLEIIHSLWTSQVASPFIFNLLENLHFWISVNILINN